MAHTELIKQQMVDRMGFIPPFFVPAFDTPEVLANLWYQTQTAYLDNPIPAVFKEKLAALLARYCSVPYCLVCHSSSLGGLGLSGDEVLELLLSETKSVYEIGDGGAFELPVKVWPAAESVLEKIVLDCSIQIFLGEDARECTVTLKKILGEAQFNWLSLFIAYNKTCLSWAETHPEISYHADHRYKSYMGNLLDQQPELEKFFTQYKDMAESDFKRKSRRLSEHAATYFEKEKHLREELELLNNLVPQIIWTARPDGVLNYTNQRWTDYSGSQNPEDWASYVHPDDQPVAFEKWSRSIQSGEDYDIQFRLRNQLGEYRWFLSRAKPVYSSSMKLERWYGTCTDIHEQVVSQQILISAQQQAEEANRAKSLFLAHMSHEIRTPLAAILGFSKLLYNKDLNYAERTQLLDTIQRSGWNLTQIINDILDLSKVESDQFELSLDTVSLADVVRESINLLRGKAEEKGLSIQINVAKSAQVSISLDSIRFKQILINLIGNSIKFSQVGSIRVSVDYSDSLIRVKVEDRGIGLTHDQALNLFKDFSQGDSSVNRKFGGTGLGLSLSKKLAQKMGGDLSLLSYEEGNGTVFEFTVRAESVEDAKSRVLNDRLRAGVGRFENIEITRTLLSGFKIAVVDDSEDNLYLIEEFLRQVGGEVEATSQPFEALNLYLESKPDLYLVDIQMPGKDGFQVIESLRSTQEYINRPIPILAISAHAMVEARELALKKGFDDYLTKPIDPDQMVRTIAHYLKRMPTAQ